MFVFKYIAAGNTGGGHVTLGTLQSWWLDSQFIILSVLVLINPETLKRAGMFVTLLW